MTGTSSRQRKVARGGRWSRSNRRRDDAARRERRIGMLTLLIGGPIVVALLGSLLFGERGLIRFTSMADHHQRLKTGIAALEADNAALRHEIDRLKTDPVMIEEIARERLGMGRRGEVVYRFDPASPSPP